MRDSFVLSFPEQLRLLVLSGVRAWRGVLAHSPVLYAHISFSLPGRDVKNARGCLQVPDTQKTLAQRTKKGRKENTA